MKYECDLVRDVVSLYKDQVLSEKSVIAVTEHLSECDSCKKFYDEFSDDALCMPVNDENTSKAVNYGKKIRRRKIILTIVIPIATIILAFFLNVLYQAVIIMEHQRTTTVSDIEVGTYNLTFDDLVCSADEIGQYTLFTDSTQIVVCVQSKSVFEGTVMLWNADNKDEHIMIASVNKDKNSCVFTNLTSESRYRISVNGFSDDELLISGSVSFGQAIMMVLDNIF